jgi:imidazolonepropionase-like amidohydrolase
MLDGPTPTWAYAVPIADAAAARAAVRTFKARGVDFLKTYSLLPRDAFFALADEAKKQHIPFAGHLPITVSALEASNAGMASMEHGHGLQEACSSRDSSLRAEQQRLIGELIAAKEHNLLVEPMYVEQAQTAFATYDAARCTALFDAFVRNGTAQVPTLLLLQSWAREHDPRRLDDPRYRYIPELLRNSWEAFADAPQADVPDSRAVRAQRLQWIEDLVGEMQRAGVMILAGTEEGGASFIYPGFAIHDELQLMVASGLTPLQALQTATINPARFLHATDSLGTVAVGKRADLLLLDADPLANIANTRTIQAVIADGRLFDRARLDFLLGRVAAIAAR